MPDYENDRFIVFILAVVGSNNDLLLKIGDIKEPKHYILYNTKTRKLYFNNFVDISMQKEMIQLANRITIQLKSWCTSSNHNTRTSHLPENDACILDSTMTFAC